LTMKILVTDAISEEGIGILRRQAQVDVKAGLKPEEITAIIGDYEALIVRSQTKVTAGIIAAAGKLQIIARAGVGIDNIDVEAATRRGILVVNAPEGNIVSTAEHTMAMLMALARRIPMANRQLQAGVWNRKIKGYEIRNKTLGIIGLGRVGTEVSHLAKGMHMEVIACDPMVSEARAERLGIRLVEIKTLLQTSDFVTVHVPLNSSTAGMVGRNQINMLKPTAMLINCARGGIVDEKALLEALNKGSLAGAAIDVFEQEPTQDNALLQSDKVVATPHLAASTVEAEISASRDIAEQVVAVLKGDSPKSPVNSPMISREAMPVVGPYFEVGKTIGRVAVQLISGHPKTLTISYNGAIAREDTDPIKVAVLSGLLEMLTDEPVNIINADIIAANRGLNVIEKKDSASENYTSMLSVEMQTSSGRTLVAGSSLRGRTYLTRVDDYWLDIEPIDSYMMFTEHKDRPGIIGAVGSIIGDAGVNISQMQVSVGIKRGDKAMIALCLSKPLSLECYQRILAIPDMYRALIVKLNG